MSAATLPVPVRTPEPVPSHPRPQPHRATARVIGALFLAGFLCYGVGFALVTSVIDGNDVLAGVHAHPTRLVLGVCLMLLNTAVDIGKGVLFFPVLERHGRRSALAYLAALVVEVALLDVGALCLLLLGPLADHALATGSTDAAWAQGLATLAVDANSTAYQLAEMTLGAGGVVLCLVLLRARLVPRTLAVWGVCGYVVLTVGNLAELFALHIGLLLSVPGGLFEIALGVWLLARGFSAHAVSHRGATDPTLT